MAGSDFARRASSTGTDHDTVEIERDNLSLGRYAGHCDSAGIGQTRRRRTNHDGIRSDFSDLVLQLVAQRADTVINRHPLQGSRGSCGETTDARKVFGPGTAPALLAAAAEERHQVGPPGATSAAAAGGPASLCADRLIKSAPISSASRTSFPAACTASQ